jgi:hypothetical protein
MLDSGIKDRLELLKAERVDEILNDDSLSKIDKLKTIEKEKLWGYATYIQHEFSDWEKEVIELERIEAERLLELGDLSGTDICYRVFYQSKMTDSIFDPSRMIYEKHESVSYAEALEMCYDEHFDENEDEAETDNPLITVITTRHPFTVLKKPYKDIVDCVFNYACENKIIGFKNDW